MERAQANISNHGEHFQPKNVAQIISGNILALDRTKAANYNSNYTNSNNVRLREMPITTTESQIESTKKRPSSYNEYRNNSGGLPQGSSSPVTSH